MYKRVYFVLISSSVLDTHKILKQTFFSQFEVDIGEILMVVMGFLSLML